MRFSVQMHHNTRRNLHTSFQSAINCNFDFWPFVHGAIIVPSYHIKLWNNKKSVFIPSLTSDLLHLKNNVIKSQSQCASTFTQFQIHLHKWKLSNWHERNKLQSYKIFIKQTMSVSFSHTVTLGQIHDKHNRLLFTNQLLSLSHHQWWNSGMLRYNLL